MSAALCPRCRRPVDVAVDRFGLATGVIGMTVLADHACVPPVAPPPVPQRAPITVGMPCAVCGAAVPPPLRANKPRRTCSDACLAVLAGRFARRSWTRGAA